MIKDDIIRLQQSCFTVYFLANIREGRLASICYVMSAGVVVLGLLFTSGIRCSVFKENHGS